MWGPQMLQHIYREHLLLATTQTANRKLETWQDVCFHLMSEFETIENYFCDLGSRYSAPADQAADQSPPICGHHESVSVSTYSQILIRN